MKKELFQDLPDHPEYPGIILTNPKYSRNVAGILRAANCFGVKQLAFTGDRVHKDLHNFSRLPREERMKDYEKVELFNTNKPFDFFKGATPVAVELLENSECLSTFQHPENAVYVFGPEDGSVPPVFRRHCHRFITIPSKHCLNLAAAAYVILYDRAVKAGWKGNMLDEDRGFIEETESQLG